MPSVTNYALANDFIFVGISDETIWNFHLVSALLPSQTLVVIDSNVDDPQWLASGVIEGATALILDPNRDGIEQITEALQKHPATTLQIIAHAAPGCLYLGNTQLSLETIAQYTPLLQSWFSSSQEGISPSLLLYGCNAAAGDAGAEFLDKLHHLTGANLAASTQALGKGNWHLETQRFRGNDRILPLAIYPTVLTNYSGLLGVPLGTEAGDGQVSIDNMEATGDASGTQYDFFGSQPLQNIIYAWETYVRIGSSGERLQLSGDNGFAASTPTSATGNSFNFTQNNQTVSVTVEQTLENIPGESGRAGGQLKQIYTFSNTSDSDVSLEFFRYLDIDLSGSGNFRDDGGGRLVVDGRDWLFQTDVTVDANTATDLIGLAIDGGSELTGRFEVGEFSALRTKVASGNDLANTVLGDGDDADELVDIGNGGDIAVARGKGLTVPAGGSVSLTVYTNLGKLALNEVPAPTDTTPPDATFSPTDNSTDVAIDSDLTLTFDETIQKGTGTIVIKKVSDDSVVETIDVSGNNVTIGQDGMTVTINPTDDLVAGTEYYIEVANTAFKDVAATPNSYAGITGKTTWNFTTQAPEPPADTTPPTVVSFSPTDDATNVAVDSNLVLTFNEAVKAVPDGRIIIFESYDSDSEQVTEIDIADTSQVTIEGSTVTINPTADLEAGKTYTIGIFPGTLTDLAGNSTYPTPSETSWNFTTAGGNEPGDTTAPTVVSFSPTDDATNVAVDSNLVITFNEEVKAGPGGAITLFDDNLNLLTEIDLADITQVTIEGNTITINPTDDLEAGKTYSIAFSDEGITDLAGNFANPTPSETSWNFTTAGGNEPGDTTPPFIEVFSPDDEATGIAVDSNLVITFSEEVLKGQGNINLYLYDPDPNSSISPVESIDVSSDRVTIDGKTVTINPESDLAPGTRYVVAITGGAFTDKSPASNAFEGISREEDWDFTTVDDNSPGDTTPPEVVSFSPTDDATDVAIDSNLVLTFNEAVKAVLGGTIEIYESYSDENDSEPVMEIDITDTKQVTIEGNTVTINPTDDLAAGKTYTIGFSLEPLQI